MSSLAGTGTLAKLIGRRDRIRLPVWVYVTAGLAGSTAFSLRQLYKTAAERLAFAATIQANGALRALTGRVFDGSTLGGLTTWRFASLGATAAAVMSVLTVIRHTRAEEESGRAELTGSGVVGRFAPLTAALTVTGLVNAAIALVTALLMIFLGASPAGSVALGSGVGAAGLVFGAVAGVTAQLTNSSRPATGLAMTVLGAAFLARASGDAAGRTGPGWLTWLSPLGWPEMIRPYARERWWVLGLMLVVAAGLTLVAYALSTRRDVGAGLFADRPGPAVAPPSLSGATALAWRLQRGSLYGWVAGFLVAGLAYGGTARGIGSLIGTSKQMADIIARMGGAGGIETTYLSATLGITGLIASAYGIQAVLRLRGEETAGHAEWLLATPLSRMRWLAGHLVIAFAGSAAVVAAAGIGSGLAYGIAVGDVPGQVVRLAAASLASWPAVAVVVGFTVVVAGLLPRSTALAWAGYGALVLLGDIGAALRLPRVVLDVSPFTHVPKVPGGAVHALPIVILLVIAAALTATGAAALRRRDIPAN